MAERCATCIFRPGNLMELRPGRVKEMVDAVNEADGCIPCHETLDDEIQAVCRGQFDTHKTLPLKLAEAMNFIIWHEREEGND